jgi:predicted molibdopterin-dependent oxidoreductase YjgC
VKIYSRAVARISVETAALLSLKEGDPARISTKAGALELPVSIDKTVDPMTVMLTNNFEGKGAFSLVEYTVDPVTKAPVIEGIEVGIEKG